jgi:hypothetical protein
VKQVYELLIGVTDHVGEGLVGGFSWAEIEEARGGVIGHEQSISFINDHDSVAQAIYDSFGMSVSVLCESGLKAQILEFILELPGGGVAALYFLASVSDGSLQVWQVERGCWDSRVGE